MESSSAPLPSLSVFRYEIVTLAGKGNKPLAKIEFLVVKSPGVALHSITCTTLLSTMYLMISIV
jgi:hypothetical protein